MQGFCKMVRRSSRYTDFDLLFLDHFQEHYDEAKEASELMSGPRTLFSLPSFTCLSPLFLAAVKRELSIVNDTTTKPTHTLLP